MAFGITFAMMKSVVAVIGTEHARDSEVNMCPSGYHGNYCRELCPHPFFGNHCKGICQCNPHLCHHIRGCPSLGTNCPLGFTGRYCQTTCQYPHYGIACQQTCSCSKTRCSSSTGCAKIDTISFHRNSQKRNITTATKNKGTNETINKTENLSTANGTVKGKSIPKQHPQVNKNTWTHSILLSLGIVLAALVIVHALLSVNNCVKRRNKITCV